MMEHLNGKNAIITGGSRGIGSYIARVFAAEGINLALVALPGEMDLLNNISNELQGTGVKVITIGADITKKADRETIMKRTESELGPIDILINNVGIEAAACFIRQDEEVLSRTIDTNLKAPILLTKMILPGMLKRKAGHVISLSSLAGKVGTSYQAAYSGTKAGIIKWSAAMRDEFRELGVSFSVVIPGYVAGAGMLADYREKAGKEYKAPPLLGEVTAEQVAKAVLKALQKDRMELIAAPGAMRFFMALNELFPGIAAKISGFTGAANLNQEMAEDL